MSTDCQMTFADHAEAWCRETGESVPDRDTTEWQEMYQEWIKYAFDGIGES